jgi:hypothetical protein
MPTYILYSSSTIKFKESVDIKMNIIVLSWLIRCTNG